MTTTKEFRLCFFFFFFLNVRVINNTTAGPGRLRFSVKIFRMIRDEKIFKQPLDTTISIINIPPNETGDPAKSPPPPSSPTRDLWVR